MKARARGPQPARPLVLQPQRVRVCFPVNRAAGARVRTDETPVNGFLQLQPVSVGAPLKCVKSATTNSCWAKLKVLAWS